MNEMKGYRRKNYFIKKGFQGRYMFNVYLLFALLILVFTVLLSFNTAQYLTISYENYDLQVASTPAILFRHLLMASWIIMIPLGLIMAWVVTVTITIARASAATNADTVAPAVAAFERSNMVAVCVIVLKGLQEVF